MPITNNMSEVLTKSNGVSFVKTPKTTPKNAGATDALLPSDAVGVSKIANTKIQLKPPKSLGSRIAIPYQHARTSMLPNK